MNKNTVSAALMSAPDTDLPDHFVTIMVELIARGLHRQALEALDKDSLEELVAMAEDFA